MHVAGHVPHWPSYWVLMHYFAPRELDYPTLSAILQKSSLNTNIDLCDELTRTFCDSEDGFDIDTWQLH